MQRHRFNCFEKRFLLLPEVAGKRAADALVGLLFLDDREHPDPRPCPCRLAANRRGASILPRDGGRPSSMNVDNVEGELVVVGTVGHDLAWLHCSLKTGR